jgi:hypothetical protein
MKLFKVLVVDDDLDLLLALCEALTFLGYKVSAARTVSEANLSLGYRLGNVRLKTKLTGRGVPVVGRRTFRINT